MVTTATVVATIALCCAAAAVSGGGTASSLGNTASSAPSSKLTNLPKLSVPWKSLGSMRLTPPKSPVVAIPVQVPKRLPQRNPQQPNQQWPLQPYQRWSQQQPQRPSQKNSEKPRDQSPQKQLQPPQTTTVKSTVNVTRMTSPRPFTLETTTQDRSIITVPLKSCPEGQRMGPDRNCKPEFSDPEGDQA